MPTPTTREGYEKLKAELDQLENVELPRVARLIADARSEGDLRENAEYHAQRETMGMLQAKTAQLRTRLADCVIMDKGNMPKDKIVFGRVVTLKNLDDHEEEKFELVGPGEEDYTGEVMKILVTSPMAQQLLNHKVGDQVEVTTPGGAIRYQVLGLD